MGKAIMLTFGVIFALLLMGALSPQKPQSYLDAAKEYEKECASHRGYGEWALNPQGLSLDDWCAIKARQRAHKEMREEYPNG